MTLATRLRTWAVAGPDNFDWKNMELASRANEPNTTRYTVPASGLRRIAAFGVDYLAISVYIVLLVLLGLAVTSVAPSVVETVFGGRIIAQLAGFLLITVPVALYFALQEASSRRATLGKRALGIQVVRAPDDRLSLGRSLGRTALKFLPWELAHTVIWHAQFGGAETPVFIGGLILVWGLIGIYLVSLFLTGMGKAIYDRVADTRVIRVRPSPLASGAPGSDAH